MVKQPIMCTLSPDALRNRRDGLLGDLIRLAEERTSTEDGLRVVLAPSSETLALVARVVEAERQCCRFLRFTIVVEPDGGPIVLELSGPPGTREFVSALLDV